MSWFIREYNKYAEASSILTFMEAGGSIYKPSDEELAAFKSAAQSVETWFVKNASQETKTWFTNYKRVIKQHKERLRAIRAMEIH